jgi:hypothetical protein
MDALHLRKTSPVPIEYEAWWALKPVWAFWRREKSLAPARIRNPDHPARSLVTIPTEVSPEWLQQMNMEHWYNNTDTGGLKINLLQCHVPHCQ